MTGPALPGGPLRVDSGVERPLSALQHMILETTCAVRTIERIALTSADLARLSRTSVEGLVKNSRDHSAAGVHKCVQAERAPSLFFNPSSPLGGSSKFCIGK
jgi:hypothetical protein